MTPMKTLFRLAKALILALLLQANALDAMATECQTGLRTEPVNLTVPVTIQLPPRVGTESIGAVLYKKESTLAQLTGTHRVITGGCIEKIKKSLNGRITARQNGFNTFATPLPGIGLRLTVIYDKPGATRKEWVLPFNVPVTDFTQTALTTDDIKLRFEAVKTGPVQSGTLNFRLPSLLSLNDNSLVVNLALTVLAAKAHCAILVPNPQIDLPPINATTLASNAVKAAYPVAVNISCLNTNKTSINIEGANDPQAPTVFRNVSQETPAGGVGIEMLYNGNVMMPSRPIDIVLPQQQNGYSLPLSVRYAKNNEKITSGRVKAQITLRINYL